MGIHIHLHATERMEERGVTKNEIIETIQKGEVFPAKFGRMGFRHNFIFEQEWKNKYYSTKQVEVYAVKEDEDMVVITVISKYF